MALSPYQQNQNNEDHDIGKNMGRDKAPESRLICGLAVFGLLVLGRAKLTC